VAAKRLHGIDKKTGDAGHGGEKES